MGCTSSFPEDGEPDGGSRSRGYSTMGSKSPGKQRGITKVKDGREEMIAENYDFVHAGVTIKAAWVSRRGYYPENPDKDNQDSLSFLPSFGNRQNQSFFAVYDGHGKDGHVVSRYCANDLPTNVKTGLDQQVLRRDGSNMVVRGVVQAVRRVSGSFISARSGGSAEASSNSLNLGEIKLERVDSRGSSHSPNIIYEDAPSSHPGHLSGVEYNSDGSLRDANLTGEEVHQALIGAHVKTNENLKNTKGSESSSSGTTSISMLLRDGAMYVSNVGDSRAVLVGRNADGKVVTSALSHDQTPYRKDERDRVRKTGARVMSMDQIEGLAPITDDGWGDITLGEDIDESGDPPRVWHPEIVFPGCAFTRSLGDLQAKALGVIAEPEVMDRKMEPGDQYYVLASDGVFEFITNKTVGDLVAGIGDPLEACKEIAHMAYDLWLANEVRTDDITIIILKVMSGSPTIVLEEADSGDEDDDRGIRIRSDSKGHIITGSNLLRLGLPQGSMMKMPSLQRPSATSVGSEDAGGDDTWRDSTKGNGGSVGHGHGDTGDDGRDRRATLRDYRTRLSYQIFGGGASTNDSGGGGGNGNGGDGSSSSKSSKSSKSSSSRKRPSLDSMQPGHAGTYKVVEKNAQDTATISTAISNNFLFQYLTEDQRKSVLDRMTPIDVCKGDVIIAQGGRGEMESNHFYVVDSGRFSVTQDGREIHVYVGDRASGRHPGFGELSLLYDKPRAASVTALTDGRLFALSRDVFKDVLIYSVDARRVVFKCLRSIPRLQCLNHSKVETLSNLMSRKGELRVRAGEVLLTEAEPGRYFTIVISGKCDVYNKDEAATAFTTRGSRPLQHGLVLHRGYTYGITALTSDGGEAGLEGFKIVAKTDVIVYQVTKEAFESEFGSLENLQAQHQYVRNMQRRPSAVAPPSLDDVDFLGLSFADETSRLSIGSFRAQIKGRANVSVMSFILSEVEANKLQGRVHSTLESCRMITANIFNDDYYKQSEAFLPKIINTYRHPNALHVLFDRPIICSLLSIIQNPTLEKIPLEKDTSVGYVMGSLVVALQALHKMGIMYRSLHPEGIMIDDKGRLQLFDFGLSKTDGVGGKSFTICGIANYLAPEMVFHQQPHNEAVDFWSLGVLLHELICGDYPFAGDNEIATYSKIAAYAQCKSDSKRRDMLPLQRKTSLEKAASPLVEALLNPDPSARLGMPVAGDRGKGEAALKNHSFFKDSAIKTDLNRMRSVQSPLIARLVKEKEIIATNATEDTHSLLELFFAETAISGAEKAAGKHWLDELA